MYQLFPFVLLGSPVVMNGICTGGWGIMALQDSFSIVVMIIYASNDRIFIFIGNKSVLISNVPLMYIVPA